MSAQFSQETTMSDDFLNQIQETEKKAELLVEQARKSLQDDVDSLEKQLLDRRKNEVDKNRKSYQEHLAQKNIEGREVFEQKQAENKKFVQGVRKDAEEKLGKMMPAVDAFFLNELLS